MFLALNVRVYHFYIALGQGFLKNAPANSVSILIVQKKQRYVTLHPSMEGFTSLSAESCLLPLLARSYRTSILCPPLGAPHHRVLPGMHSPTRMKTKIENINTHYVALAVSLLNIDPSSPYLILPPFPSYRSVSSPTILSGGCSTARSFRVLGTADECKNTIFGWHQWEQHRYREELMTTAYLLLLGFF